VFKVIFKNILIIYFSYIVEASKEFSYGDIPTTHLSSQLSLGNIENNIAKSKIQCLIL